MEPSTERWDRRVPECLVPACHLPKGPQLEPSQSLQFPRSGHSGPLAQGTALSSAVGSSPRTPSLPRWIAPPAWG